MWKWVLVLGCAFNLCAVQVESDNIDKNYFIEKSYVYQGDREGHYFGDPALKLTDGSHWKIFGQDARIVAKWKKTHPIRVELRMDYWPCCKPRHLFLLHNPTYNQSVRAMFVHHSNRPLKVNEVQGRKFALSDGTQWAFRAGDGRYLPIGTRVYILPYDPPRGKSVLIIGKERSADAVIVSRLGVS